MIRAIVFDFGNVVGFFDHRRASGRLAELGQICPDALHADLFGGPLEDDYEAGRIGTDEFLRRLRALGRFSCADEELVRAYADIFWPNEPVCALIPRLRGRYRLLLGSNTSELHSLHFRRQFADVLRHFDAVVLSHEIGARKPSRAFFECCERFAGYPADACLFIDDLPANVDGARAAGWHGVQYTGFYDLCRRLVEVGIVIDRAAGAEKIGGVRPRSL